VAFFNAIGCSAHRAGAPPVVTSYLVPMGCGGWLSLVGWLADFVGRRKPVLNGGA